MKLLEKDITKQIRDYLKVKGILHIKPLQGLGATPGLADILCCLRPSGRFVAIEIKTERGNLTDNQRDFLQAVRLHGGTGFVARSVDDVIEKLKEIEEEGRTE